MAKVEDGASCHRAADAAALQLQHEPSRREGGCMPASLTILIAMIVAVASVALYRKMLIREEYETLHMANPLRLATREVAHTLKQVERLGIGLTIATVIYGIALLEVFLYHGLMDGTLG